MSGRAEQRGYRAFRELVFWIPPPDLASFELRGTDAGGWLHGQVTQDIVSMGEGEARTACLCAVTGQIRSVLEVANLGDRLEVTLPASTADLFEKRFEETVFMEDVALSKGQPCLNGLHPPSEETLEAVRLEKMIPEWGKDIDDKTFPQELGKAFEKRTVSYTKGCYTGQEVIMRIHSRGHTNRSWVQLRCESLLRSGSEVRDAIGKKVGTVTSAAISPKLGPLAAAMLRNEAAQAGTKLTIDGIQAIVANPTSS